jgi:hypothetical protein
MIIVLSFFVFSSIFKLFISLVFIISVCQYNKINDRIFDWKRFHWMAQKWDRNLWLLIFRAMFFIAHWLISNSIFYDPSEGHGIVISAQQMDPFSRPFNYYSYATQLPQLPNALLCSFVGITTQKSQFISFRLTNLTQINAITCLAIPSNFDFLFNNAK